MGSRCKGSKVLLPEGDWLETLPNQCCDHTVPSGFSNYLLYHRNQSAVILNSLLFALFTDIALVHESLFFYIQSNCNLYFSKCFLLCLKCNYTHISYTLTLIPFDIIENT